MKINETLIFIAIFLTSCAHKELLTVTSSPSKATVSYYNKELKSYKKVGQTPYQLKRDDQNIKSVLGDEFVVLKIEKSGYITESFLFDTATKKKADFHAELNNVESWTDRDRELSSTLANDVAKKVQEINRLTFRKEHEQALRKINRLIELYPKAHLFFDIKGSIHLLMGNKEDSISSLKKSLSLNPDNYETKSTLDEITKKGGR